MQITAAHPQRWVKANSVCYVDVFKVAIDVSC